MSIKTYIPANTAEVLSSFLAEGFKESPSYGISSETTPFKRKLNEISKGSVSEVELKSLPLILPEVHSSGSPLKARSFDTEFFVRKEGNTGNHFLLTVLGDTFATLRFKEKQNSRYIYEIDTLNTNLLDLTVLGDSFSRLVCSTTLEKSIISGYDGKSIEGYAVPFLETDFRYVTSVVTVSGTSQRLLYLDVTSSLSEKDDLRLREVDIISYNTFDNFKTKLKYFSTAELGVSTFVGNTRDLLKDSEDFAMFIGELNTEGTSLFNVENYLDTTSDLINYDIILDPFGKSSLLFYQGEEGYAEFKELTFTLEESSFKSVEVFRKVDNTKTLLARKDYIGTPLEWANFFEAFGISCYLGRKGTNLSFALQKIVELEAISSKIQVVFNATKDGESTTKVSGKLACFEQEVTPTNVVPAYPAYKKTSGGFSNAFNIATIGLDQSESNLGSFFIKSTKEDFVFSCARAESLDTTKYSRTSAYTATFTRSPFFNNGYGVRRVLEGIVDNMRNIGLNTISTNTFTGNVIIDTNSTSFKKIYLRSSIEDTIGSTSSKSLSTSKEVLLQFDPSKKAGVPVRQVGSIPYIVVDLTKVEHLTLTPFSYITGDTLLKEQTTAEYDITEYPFTTAVERRDLIEKSAKELSKSLTSVFFHPTIPLYTEEGVFSECILIGYNPSTVSGVTLENSLLRVESSAVVFDSRKGLLKYFAGYRDGAPFYNYISNSPLSFSKYSFEDYIEIKGEDTTSTYSTEVSVYIQEEFSLSLSYSALDLLNKIERTVTEETIEDFIDDYINIVQEGNTLVLSIKESSSIDRFSLELSLTEGSTIKDVGLCVIEEDSFIIPLSKR